MPITDRIDPRLLQKVNELPKAEQAHILSLIEELKSAEQKQEARNQFMDFVHCVDHQ